MITHVGHQGKKENADDFIILENNQLFKIINVNREYSIRRYIQTAAFLKKKKKESKLLKYKHYIVPRKTIIDYTNNRNKIFELKSIKSDNY
jgi:hypothetical protein